MLKDPVSSSEASGPGASGFLREPPVSSCRRGKKALLLFARKKALLLVDDVGHFILNFILNADVGSFILNAAAIKFIVTR